MLVYESKVIACQIYAVFPLRPADQSTLGSTAHSLSFLQRRGGGGITADSCGNTRITGYMGITQDLCGALRTETLKPQLFH